eukprot:6678992-Prymnesium_polylepis.1
MEVTRAAADLNFEMISQLAGSNHWAAALPLPDKIPFELRHTATDKLVFAGEHDTSSGGAAVLVDTVIFTSGIGDWEVSAPAAAEAAPPSSVASTAER